MLVSESFHMELSATPWVARQPELAVEKGWHCKDNKNFTNNYGSSEKFSKFASNSILKIWNVT